MKNNYIITIIISVILLISCKEKSVSKNNSDSLKENDTISKDGWVYIYEPNGNLLKKEEYLVDENRIALNQWVYYYPDGSIDYDTSSFFLMELPDTLKLGKNKGFLKFYDPSKAMIKHMYVAIENEYEDGNIKTEEFADEYQSTVFGVYAVRTGLMTVKGKVVQQLIDHRETQNDSAEMTITEHYKFFEKEVYVTD